MDRVIRVPKKKYEEARMYKEIFRKNTSRNAPLWWCLVEAEKDKDRKRPPGGFRL